MMRSTGKPPGVPLPAPLAQPNPSSQRSSSEGYGAPHGRARMRTIGDGTPRMDTRTLAPGTVLKNRYRVKRLVAGGGMAYVYEVEEILTDGSRRTWALKELRSDSESTGTLEEARSLFEQEANILVRLDHPNLPKVVAYFQEDGRSYLVMEFIHGESLERRLQNANAPLLENQVLDWAVQVCEVLSYLHSRPQPVIFRDLKPSNIMATADGSIKLIDFGIARTYKAGQRKDTVTMGSENYAAPEQWGEAQSDPRADLYGLGATMYHLLANVPPLPAFVPSERVPVQQYNPAVSDRTAALIERAMAPDREQRYASADEMRAALLECMSWRERRRAQARADARAAAHRQAREGPARPASRPPAASPTPTQTPSASRTPSAAPNRPAERPSVAPQPAPEAASAAEPFGATVEEAPPAAAATPSPPPATPRRLARPTGERFCPNCGASNRPGARFCGRCGQRLVGEPYGVLVLVEPAPARWEYPLRRNVALLGRRGGSLPVDLDIGYYDPEGYVSRNHARITSHRGSHHVIDLGSANGTYVNGERLTPRRPRLLAPGDRIRVGQIVLSFVLREDPLEGV